MCEIYLEDVWTMMRNEIYQNGKVEDWNKLCLEMIEILKYVYNLVFCGSEITR